MLEYQNIGVSFSLQHSKFMMCFKSYKRNGKTFWRNYKRNVKGGISILDFMALRRAEAERAMIVGIAQNVYS